MTIFYSVVMVSFALAAVGSITGKVSFDSRSYNGRIQLSLNYVGWFLVTLSSLLEELQKL